ncbi:putative calcium-transporting ATPase 13, plasma membrane-type [Euphorbia lathyris]|uniref:putative calcium-transporting ATPase 13, plasma membrane-type n=1 Tax=Euphorbia lathyris TaxID=212925 RepID=UPI003313AFD4
MSDDDYLLEVPSPTTQPAKRWHLAFATIGCSRAIQSLIPKKKLSHSKSFLLLDIKPENNTHQTTLTQLVREKNHKNLQDLGGVSGIASSIETDLQNGINGDDYDILLRQEAFGSNTYKKPPTKGFFHFVAEAFKDLTIVILLVCAALFLGFGIKEHGLKEGWYDAGSIVVAVFLVIAVSSVSNYRQNRQFDKLSKVSNNIQIEVVRSGRRQHVSIFQLVVGDVVFLKIGDQVPADGILISGHSLLIDESSMTGESDHVEINHNQNPFIMSGTKVADGYGKMLVTSVGMNTTWGEMMSPRSRGNNEETPLQARLNKLYSAIEKIGLAAGFLVLVVLLVRYFTGNTKDEDGNVEFNGSKTKADDILNSVAGIVAAAVTVLLVVIPEGLSLAVTLTLAYSMKRMMSDQALVRKLSACETMGSATTICTDKTGILTMNRMKVTKFFLGQESDDFSPNVVELVRDGVPFNTTGSAYRANPQSEFEFSGSPTEKAILSWGILDLGMDMERQKENFIVLNVEAFNSKNKRSGVLIRKKLDNTIHLHWKGAAEMILAMCSTYYDASGMIIDMDDHQRTFFEQIIQGMAAESLRCMAFAHSQEYSDGTEGKNIRDNNLTLLGFVGIKDPCRPEVKKAVEDCQNAGVSIKMITGDNVYTAKAVAIECGILKPGEDTSEAVVEGEQFRNYTPEERMEKVEKIRVMARSSPFDNLLMVQCLKREGEVVAVTGDGTNDALALKEADIGLSMGIQGTEVAKESSDIVILDNSFASVATVLKWGRCVYNNIQKFIQLQLTANAAGFVINFVAAVSAGKVPLTAVRLLWVNLIMDTLGATLGALALATEQPTKDLMDKKPVGQTEPLITNIMWRNLLSQAFYQIIVLLTLQFRGESIFGVSEEVNDTLIFIIFVLCQVFNEFNARKLEKKNVFKGILKNKLFIGIIAVTILLQVLMVEFLKKFTDIERLNWGQWGICIGFAALTWPIGWAVKFIPVPEKQIFSYLKWNK